MNSNILLLLCAWSKQNWLRPREYTEDLRINLIQIKRIIVPDCVRFAYSQTHVISINAVWKNTE